MQVQGYVVEPELTVYMVKPKDTTYIYQALHAFTECAMKNKTVHSIILKRVLKKL